MSTQWGGVKTGWIAELSVVISGTKSSWRPLISSVPQASILGPTLFNIFINDLNDWVEQNLSQFAENTKLGRVADTPEDHATIQSDLDGLERLADWNLMQSNWGKSKALHLEGLILQYWKEIIKKRNEQKSSCDKSYITNFFSFSLTTNHYCKQQQQYSSGFTCIFRKPVEGMSEKYKVKVQYALITTFCRLFITG